MLLNLMHNWRDETRRSVFAAWLFFLHFHLQNIAIINLHSPTDFCLRCPSTALAYVLGRLRPRNEKVYPEGGWLDSSSGSKEFETVKLQIRLLKTTNSPVFYVIQTLLCRQDRWFGFLVRHLPFVRHEESNGKTDVVLLDQPCREDVQCTQSIFLVFHCICVLFSGMIANSSQKSHHHHSFWSSLMTSHRVLDLSKNFSCSSSAENSFLFFSSIPLHAVFWSFTSTWIERFYSQRRLFSFNCLSFRFIYNDYYFCPKSLPDFIITIRDDDPILFYLIVVVFRSEGE